MGSKYKFLQETKKVEENFFSAESFGEIIKFVFWVLKNLSKKLIFLACQLFLIMKKLAFIQKIPMSSSFKTTFDYYMQQIAQRKAQVAKCPQKNLTSFWRAVGTVTGFY